MAFFGPFVYICPACIFRLSRKFSDLQSQKPQPDEDENPHKVEARHTTTLAIFVGAALLGRFVFFLFVFHDGVARNSFRVKIDFCDRVKLKWTLGRSKNDSFLNFAELRHLGITPKLFKLVEPACFRVKNVYDGIEIIHQNPLGIAGTFRVEWSGLKLFFYLFMNAVCDGFDVRVGIAFTNDKKVGWGITQFPQIELHDVLAFFVADTLNDEMVELFELRLFSPLFGNTDQIVEII